MKILSGLIVVLILVAVVFGVYLSNNMNGLVKEAIEDVGSETLKTAVTVEDVNIQLLQGKVSLRGLAVANLPNFNEPTIFQMDEISVGVDVMSLVDSLVNVTEIRIDGAKVTAEQKALGTNIQALLKNLEGDSNETKQPESSESTSSPDIKIRIGEFHFANSVGRLVSDRWGDRDIKIPGVDLANIGGDKGLPPEALADAILKPILKQLNQAIKDSVEGFVKEKAKEKLKEKEDELKGKLNEKLKEKLGDDASDKVDAVKSLFSR